MAPPEVHTDGGGYRWVSFVMATSMLWRIPSTESFIGTPVNYLLDATHDSEYEATNCYHDGAVEKLLAIIASVD